MLKFNMLYCCIFFKILYFILLLTRERIVIFHNKDM